MIYLLYQTSFKGLRNKDKGLRIKDSQFVYKTDADKYAKNDGEVRLWQSDL